MSEEQHPCPPRPQALPRVRAALSRYGRAVPPPGTVIERSRRQAEAITLGHELVGPATEEYVRASWRHAAATARLVELVASRRPRHSYPATAALPRGLNVRRRAPGQEE